MIRCPECNEHTEVGSGRFLRHDIEPGRTCPGWFLRVAWDGDPRSEGRFTNPRPDCPAPEHWHSDDADSTEWEISALVQGFVRGLQPDLVIETGSAWGQTAQLIGKALEVNGHGELHTIEPDQVRAEYTRKRCDGLPVTVHEAMSMEWELPAPSLHIGFAWFDSLHHLRVPEFRRFYPYMNDRTMVGFHDTGPHQGGLREEIEQLETEGLLLPIHLPTPRGVTFGQVLK
jgi:hypothetical protein